MQIVVLISDCTDVAHTEMWCSLLREAQGQIGEVRVAPLAPVAPFSVLHAAFLLRLLADCVPANSILFSVVNPLQGELSRVIGRTIRQNLIFVGRDTGQFSWLLKDYGCSEMVELDRTFVPFGGKNIYPKIIGDILRGASISDLGLSRDPSTFEKIEIPNGTIVHIDNFGLLKIKEEPGWQERLQLSPGSRVVIETSAGDAVEARFAHRMMSCCDGQWVLYPGSSLYGLPELGRVRANGATELKCQLGDSLVISRQP